MRIRVLQSDDWQRWRELRLRALADSPDAFGETLEGARARDDAAWRASTAPDPARVVLLAEATDGSAVGTAVARVAADEPGRAHLYAMWVAPEARRRGVGRALVDAAMRWARLAGASALILRVTDRAPAAEALYHVLGFTPTGATEALRPGSSIPSRVLVARLGPLVMGVVNATPDSFSDGGQYLAPDAAIAHGLALVRAGADLIDVGGEATNPKATPIDAAEEQRRIEPVVRALLAAGATVSVDTTKAEVARAAAGWGVTIINDVSGGLFDPAMSAFLGEFAGTYIAGHLRGQTLAEVFAAEAEKARPPGMAEKARPMITWREVSADLGERLAALPATVRSRAWVDPGIGFGKGADPEANLALIRHAGDLGRALGCPVVVGASRKRFLRRLVGRALEIDPAEVTLDQLDAASIEASLAAVRAGAHVVRVHNVALLRAALAVYTRI